MVLYTTIFLSLCELIDPAAQIGVQEGHVACGIALTSVLHSLAVNGLEQEAGEALDLLPCSSLGLILGANHANLTLLVTNLHHALLGELGKLRLGGLAVATPIGVIHGKGIAIRGTLESLDQATVKGNAQTVHHHQPKNTHHREYQKNEFPAEHCIWSTRGKCGGEPKRAARIRSIHPDASLPEW